MAVQHKRVRIVLVDDHALAREAVRHLLSLENDFEVVGEAGGGDEALTVILQCSPDVVVMDMRMTGGNGFELVRQIKEQYPQTQVMILSMRDDSELVLRAYEAGTSGYLVKDSSRADLVQAIRTMHRGSSVLHPALGWKVLERFSQVSRNMATTARDGLTSREYEVLKLLATGQRNREIARALFISNNTLKTHIRHIQQKLGTQDRVQTVAHALRHGIIE